MTIAIEKKLRDFDFWSGAATNAAKLTYEELDRLEEMLEAWREDDSEPWTATELNDTMWFNFEDTICRILDLDPEEVNARKNRWE